MTRRFRSKGVEAPSARDTLARHTITFPMMSSPPFLFKHLQKMLDPGVGTKRDQKGIGSRAMRRLFASLLCDEEPNDSSLRRSFFCCDRLGVGV